jgi:hypothetical protein
MTGNGKSYRLIVTYNGFDEEKDEEITKAARKTPSQTGYDPVETRRTIDWTFRSRKAAGNTRTRIVVLQRNTGGFSVSKVIDDSY